MVVDKNLAMTRVGIVIPNRRDRPEFMENCLRQMWAQDDDLRGYVFVVDFPASDDDPDITKRYRVGYDYFSAFHKGHYDVIAFIENDDWYHPNYLKWMVENWIAAGKPDLFGPNFTVYYHLELRKYFRMTGDQRSAAMSTFIRPGLKINWPLDRDPYTDQWLWMKEGNGILNVNKKVFFPQEGTPLMFLGMKHGIGKCGGRNHTDKLHRFINDDPRGDFLKQHLDEESYQFFNNVFPNGNSI